MFQLRSFLVTALTFAIVCFGGQVVQAQENSSENIISYDDNIILRPFLVYPSLSLSIDNGADNENDLHAIDYSPNTMINAGANICWKGWGLSYSASLLPITQGDTGEYGETDYLDLQLYSYFNKLNIDAFYQNYRGFYQTTNYGEESKGVRPDLEMTSMGLNLMYVWSDDYSFRSSYTQTERQMRSGGSFVAMGSWNYLLIESDGSLIPAADAPYFAEEATFKGGSYHGVTLLAGYSYTLIVAERWYFSISALVGGGWMRQDYDLAEQKVVANTMCSKYNNRLSVGYDGTSWFAGMLSVIDLLSTEPFLNVYHGGSDTLVLTRMSVYGAIYGGMRF